MTIAHYHVLSLVSVLVTSLSGHNRWLDSTQLCKVAMVPVNVHLLYTVSVIAQSLHGNNNHTASLSSLHTAFQLAYYCICITWIALEYLHNMFTSWVDSMTTTYDRLLRDFAVLISTVRYSTLASVRVLFMRLSGRGNKTPSNNSWVHQCTI